MGKIYKFAEKDKAALLNGLKKAGVKVDSYEIKDDEQRGEFEITFSEPGEEEKAKFLLRSSDINKLTEALRSIIREEIKRKFGS